jgi:hypothetical protein
VQFVLYKIAGYIFLGKKEENKMNVNLDPVSLEALEDFVKPGQSKVLLKLEDGVLYPVSPHEPGLITRLQRFFGRLGFGPYSLAKIFKHVVLLAAETQNPTVVAGLKALSSKISLHNERSAALFKIDIEKVYQQAGGKAAAIAKRLMKPVAPPQPAPQPRRVEPPKTLRLLYPLRNLYFDLAAGKADAIPALRRVLNERQVGDNSLYLVREALTLCAKRANPNSPPTKEEDLTAIFQVIDTINAANTPETLRQAELGLDALARRLLTEATVPVATCDALFYTRGLVLEKKAAVTGPPRTIVVEQAPQADQRGIIPQIGDGNCLFRAFATNLARYNVPLHNNEEAQQTAEPQNVGPDRFHAYLRKEVADYLQANKQDPLVDSALIDSVDAVNEQVLSEKQARDESFPTLHERLRQKLHELAQRDYDAHAIPTDNKDASFDRYIATLRSPAFWAGQIEYVTLGRLYDVNVRVYEEVDGQIVQKPGVEFDTDTPNRPTVHLFHKDRNHFDVFVPPENR